MSDQEDTTEGAGVPSAPPWPAPTSEPDLPPPVAGTAFPLAPHAADPSHPPMSPVGRQVSAANVGPAVPAPHADPFVVGLLAQYRAGELTDKGLHAAVARHLAEIGADPESAEAVLAAAATGPTIAPPPGFSPAPGSGGDVPPAPSRQHSGRRRLWPWLAAAAALVLLLAAGGAAAWWFSGKTDRDYLSSLRSAGQGGQFASDAEAVAHAKSVCASLESGGKAQGMSVDVPGVQAYCPQFASGFKVLETSSVPGTFVLTDTSYYGTGITTTGSGCEGSGGYSDIHSGTEVVIRNGSGDTLATGELGPGTGNSSMCTFSFSVTLTEGEDDYVVTVSHRGDLHKTWAELSTEGIGVSLGD